eukprot:3406697-Rhodomonas_salina.1
MRQSAHETARGRFISLSSQHETDALASVVFSSRDSARGSSLVRRKRQSMIVSFSRSFVCRTLSRFSSSRDTDDGGGGGTETAHDAGALFL